MLKTRTTLLIPSHIACHPLKENELVRMVLTEQPSIPAGSNPFHHDLSSMGACITEEYQALFYSGKCLKEMDLYHVNGQVFRLNMYPKEQRLKPAFRFPLGLSDVRPSEQDGRTWRFYRLYQMAPGHVEAVPVDYVDVNGRDHQYICYKNDLMVSVKVLDEAAPDELYTLIAELYFDEDLIDEMYRAISGLINEAKTDKPFNTDDLKSLIEQ